VAFELTINRVGAFAGTTPGAGLDTADKLEALFQKQLEIAGGKPFDVARQGVIAEAPDFREPRAEDITEAETQQIRIRRVSLSSADDAEWTLVGTLPGLRFECTATSEASGNRRDWIVRARASVTACAIQDGGRNTKLWWTFEGVPSDDDPTNRPTSEDISAFIALTDKMADAATTSLYLAYRAAIEQTTDVDLNDFFLRENRIRVRMTDSNDYSVEALLDAVYYENVDVSEIRKDPERASAREGLVLFERFVSDVTKLNVRIPNKSLHVEGRFDGFKGIFYRVVVHEKDTVVAGFGQQSGLVSGLENAVAPEKRRLQKQENHLRAMSASRPISALLADKEASLLEPSI
jgi:hypothetical protein